MPVNAESTYEIDINSLIRLAWVTAGVMNEQQPVSGPQWTARASVAMQYLELSVKALQSGGALVRAVDFYDLDIVAGTGLYELPAETLDVFGAGMFSLDGEDVQSHVTQVPREQYHLITDKTATGRPSMYYAHRAEELAVYVWPVPDAAGTLRFQRHRLLANSTVGSNNVDLERHWMKALMFELAAWIAEASNLSGRKVERLHKRAEAEVAKATGASKQRGPIQAVLSHPTRWSR